MHPLCACIPQLAVSCLAAHASLPPPNHRLAWPPQLAAPAGRRVHVDIKPRPPRAAGSRANLPGRLMISFPLPASTNTHTPWSSRISVHRRRRSRRLIDHHHQHIRCLTSSTPQPPPLTHCHRSPPHCPVAAVRGSRWPPVVMIALSPSPFAPSAPAAAAACQDPSLPHLMLHPLRPPFRPVLL